MKKLMISAVAAATLFAGNVSAQQETINPWKHCGIGAMIFDNNGAAAAISNIIWDLGTTAVSSKISSEDSCNGKRVEAAMFIQDNFNNVIEETSQGSGNHLNAMLDILEVSQDKQSQVITQVRSELSQKSDIQPEQYYNTVIANI
ncbi:DUF3015 family protein [Salinivibrio sp. ML290]|uniref:DUF3015 family protein n=1 Tax=Salinivibrio sp. ML290 TaxID=1909468 RepID=UPI00098842EE|nr:DUF3015 family protein [Salinivibrio sp. ML290]OOE72764.1 DUF3015 domain-containing protein [Salinivibrio sp. ML290]